MKDDPTYLNEFETFEQYQLIRRIRNQASSWGFGAGLAVGFLLGMVFAVLLRLW